MENVKFEIVKGLCRINGLSLTQLEQRLGFSNGQLGKWKKSSPSVDKVSVVADYFDVSIDYLVGRKEYENGDDNFKIKLSDDIFEVVENLQSMTIKERQKAQKIIEVLSED